LNSSLFSFIETKMVSSISNFISTVFVFIVLPVSIMRHPAGIVNLNIAGACLKRKPGTSKINLPVPGRGEGKK
jgi:hypothetical protein